MDHFAKRSEQREGVDIGGLVYNIVVRLCSFDLNHQLLIRRKQIFGRGGCDPVTWKQIFCTDMISCLDLGQKSCSCPDLNSVNVAKM